MEIVPGVFPSAEDASAIHIVEIVPGEELSPQELRRKITDSRLTILTLLQRINTISQDIPDISLDEQQRLRGYYIDMIETQRATIRELEEQLYSRPPPIENQPNAVPAPVQVIDDRFPEMAISCMWCLVSAVVIPFMTTDVYYLMHNNYGCNQPNRTWLYYWLTADISMIIVLAMLKCLYIQYIVKLGIFIDDKMSRSQMRPIIRMLVGRLLLELGHYIFGSVAFYTSTQCSDSLKAYMWTRLCLSYVDIAYQINKLYTYGYYYHYSENE